MLLTTISGWLKVPLPKPSIAQPQWENEGYREEWATPYMAAIAPLVFRGKPDVTLTSELEEAIRKGQISIMREPDVTLTPQPVGGVLPRYIPLPLDSKDRPYIAHSQWQPDVTLTPQPVEERITALGTEGEWFKENRGLLIVVVSIVALVLLLFFFKKRRA